MVYRRQPRLSDFKTLSEQDRGYKNLRIVFPSNGEHGFPEVAPYTGKPPMDLVSYNSVARRVPRDRMAVHFFIHDNKFEVAWSNPAVALTRLLGVGLSLGPDFSTYSDWPLPVQMFNVYRNRWCSALWQTEGIAVIPTVSWSDRSSFSWCFEGLPENAPLAISTVGCLRRFRREFLLGYYAMVRRLDPSWVVAYGPVLPEMERCSNVIPYLHKRDAFNQDGTLG